MQPEDDAANRYLAALSPAGFSKANFRWDAYPYQQEVMNAVLLQGKRRVAWVAGRRVGKTDTIANIALQKALRKPGTEVAIFAPTMRQATGLLRRVKDLLSKSAYRRLVVVDNASQLRLRFAPDADGIAQESVIFANSMGANVRGEGADLLIVDESAFCDGDDYRNKAFPFVADRPDAVVVHTSTVWAEDDHFTAALREYATRPDGAVFRTPSRMKPGVTAEFLEEQRRLLTDAEFRREYEGEVVPESGVFDRRALAACLRDYELLTLAGLDKLTPKRNHRYFVGVDWGKKQDQAVIAVVEQGTQEKANPAKLVLLEVYKPDPDNPRHYTKVVDDVQRVGKYLNAHRVVADEGEGGHQAELLERAFGKARFEAYRFTETKKNWLVDNARALVERRAVVLPLEPEEVRKAFSNVYAVEGGGYDHASRQGKDLFDAIALALKEAKGAGTATARPPLRIATPAGARRWVGAGVAPPPTTGQILRGMFPREAWRWLPG